MSHWWRAYDEAVEDPKLQLLPPPLFKAWFNLLCLASGNDGVLPSVDVIAFKLRLSELKVRNLIAELTHRVLLDEIDGRFTPHNWNGRQYKSETVSTERVKRFRKRRRNGSETASETPPDIQSTDSETEREEDTAGAVSSPYAFESGIIRLNSKDFEKWKNSFSYLDLRAELTALTEWAGQQGDRWFHAVAGALAKRNREAKLKADKQEQQPFKWNGIEGVV